jgi:hypothetical protein
MSKKDQKKGVKRMRGATGGSISQDRANRGHRRKVLPMEVLLGEKPLKKGF